MNYGEYEDEQETLKGIVSLLLGLAALAELLCFLPLPLRALLIPPLRHAEAVTRAFAIEQVGGALALPMAMTCVADGDNSAELMRLAGCFRALASIISFFSSLQDFAERPPFRGRPGRCLAQHAQAMASRGYYVRKRNAVAFRAAGCIDTS